MAETLRTALIAAVFTALLFFITQVRVDLFGVAIVFFLICIVLTYYKQLWEKIRCPWCRGSGKVECRACTKGHLSPKLGSYGHGSLVFSKTSNGSYVIEVPNVGVDNSGYPGYGTINISVTSKQTHEVLGKWSKRIHVNGFRRKDIESAYIELGDLREITELIGREPVKEDFELDMKTDAEPGAVCGECQGKGFVPCPKCKGRRIKL